VSFLLSFKEAPYKLYYLCFFYDFVPAGRAALLVAVVQFSAAGTFRFIRFFKFASTEGAVHRLTPRNVSRVFTIKPARKAEGKMKPEIARAILNPLSFTVIMNWAMQGIKRVRVTAATTS